MHVEWALLDIETLLSPKEALVGATGQIRAFPVIRANPKPGNEAAAVLIDETLCAI